MTALEKTFATRLIQWQKKSGRHDLPWQQSRDPYRIWLSEIMLQQTQVATVIPYYKKFLERFPDLEALANAPIDEVMSLWSGLGYYSRARNLHSCAQKVMTVYEGHFPEDSQQLKTLPGIGPSTAAAISAFAFGQCAAILDGNVKRVLTRVFGIEGFPGQPVIEAKLWALAERLLPQQKDITSYTQGLMDMGATLCVRRNPLCTVCPFTSDCVAHNTSREHLLPTPKVRKASPIRACSLLVIVYKDQILFQKRPPLGIWGGLWSLPEIPFAPATSDDSHKLLQEHLQNLGMELQDAKPLTAFSHTFTHFKLNIQPWLINVKKPLLCVQEPGYAWLDSAQQLDAGMPAPIKKIMAAVLPFTLQGQ